MGIAIISEDTPVDIEVVVVKKCDFCHKANCICDVEYMNVRGSDGSY